MRHVKEGNCLMQDNGITESFYRNIKQQPGPAQSSMKYVFFIVQSSGFTVLPWSHHCNNMKTLRKGPPSPD